MLPRVASFQFPGDPVQAKSQMDVEKPLNCAAKMVPEVPWHFPEKVILPGAAQGRLPSWEDRSSLWVGGFGFPLLSPVPPLLLDGPS